MGLMKMPEVLVIAFGGNAILPSGGTGTLDEQRANVRHMAAQLGELVTAGYHVVATHGNGPQVGEIMLRSELCRDTVPPVTLDVAGAMSQGQIGLMLQQEIGNYLRRHGVQPSVVSLVTQVVVDADDPAFASPTKPIGRFYTAEAARALREEKGWTMVEDAGRGYRRVVASPSPKHIVEWPSIRSLVADGQLVIAAGGGGVPVVERSPGDYAGVEAVIDKDGSAEVLASLVGADTLVLLTEVEAVAVDFGTPRQRPLSDVPLSELKGYYEAGQFPDGSMGPKIRAVIQFLEAGGKRAIITSTRHLMTAVRDGSAGTQVRAEAPVAATRRRGPVA
jgi:carbamate kinase